MEKHHKRIIVKDLKIKNKRVISGSLLSYTNVNDFV
nr:MAG TPA: hypothetical protein [Caudoviricetes sp.]